MNGKVIVLLENPLDWGWLCQSVQQRGLSTVLTSAACDGDEGEQEIDRQRKQNL